MKIQSELTDKNKMVKMLDYQVETKKLVSDIADEEVKQKSASYKKIWKKQKLMV